MDSIRRDPFVATEDLLRGLFPPPPSRRLRLGGQIAIQ